MSVLSDKQNKGGNQLHKLVFTDSQQDVWSNDMAHSCDDKAYSCDDFEPFFIVLEWGGLFFFAIFFFFF